MRLASTVFLILLILCLFMGSARGNPATIAAAEYFFDTDPGVGLATPLAITPSSEIITFTNITATGLGRGLHTLYVRFQDSRGLWSPPTRKAFRVSTQATLSGVEYFFDTDPGEGNGQAFNFAPTSEINLFTSVPQSENLLGLHQFYARVRTPDGLWSVARGRPVRVDYISGGETYFDTDPGQGQGIPLHSQDGSFNDMDEDMYRNVLADTIPLGQHVVYTRVRSIIGWSTVVTDTVIIDQGEHFRIVPCVLDTTNRPVRLVWTNIGAQEYHVFYDSLAHGSFTNFYTVAAPETSLVVSTTAHQRFYYVIGFWEDDSRQIATRKSR